MDVVLKADGTVVVTGANGYNLINVSDWKNIVAVSAGKDHIVGLKADGTVVATGRNNSGECNVSDWKNIVAVYAGPGRTYALKADGSVICSNSEGVYADHVVAMATNKSFDRVLILHEDGTVTVKTMYVQNNNYVYEERPLFDYELKLFDSLDSLIDMKEWLVQQRG